MEDEIEDRVLHQTYVSFVKILSRFTSSTFLDAPVSYLWKMVRLYFLRSEVVVITLAIVIFLMYLQSIELWSRTMLSRLSQAMNPMSAVQRMKLMEGSDADKQSWELKGTLSAAYAIKGRRMHMEDRFIINENVNNTGISLFAIFDGHGGEFAANYAKDHLIQNLYNKIVELNAFKEGKISDISREIIEEYAPKEENVERKTSFKKSVSTADDTSKKEITDPELLAQLSKARPIITREVRTTTKPVKNINIPLSSYIDKGKINYGKLLTDEVLAADRLLVEAAKKSLNVAGTTALIAIMENNHLIVANVGDSRGVMCDSRGNAIPVSFDHKPQQVREQKRIEAAGGYIAYNGVWRVAGILATSRAMGDYPLKDKKFVIADPDILTFNLNDHKPMFLVLASDGLWDTFTNEEAVKFIKERLDEPDYGAKSLTLQAYYRGSVDNITVLVINFLNTNITIAGVQ
ncbi:protein phosphatase 1L [Bombyx mandarina]|uniref:PPM-type phosphatase domain-containing protein n=2 Tax=Bombyx TaxID=7090 RepID=A0A8R2LUX8_BOMMO|nr:protein phosphatase 1L [Bombyx mandarina]XP_037866679.1 protein phosphatase 1L [Bombyx mori]